MERIDSDMRRVEWRNPNFHGPLRIAEYRALVGEGY